LQEDKPNLFDAYDVISMSLELAAALVKDIKFREDVIAGRIEEGFLDATTLMELLVARGVPMRSAHEAVGKLVRLGEERRAKLAELPSEAFEAVQPGLATAVYRVLGVRNALNAFRSAGSTAPDEVASQLAYWRDRLASDGARAVPTST
jgi:argininosuccinate lyase